jgi:SAM-dependent methyltransferase
MNHSVAIERGRFQGVAEIVAFNWPWYAAGGLALITGVVMLQWWPLAFAYRVLGWLACGAAALWAVGSLVVSYWVYDRSPLREWRWVKRVLPRPPKTWCNIHCGLDESSGALREFFPESTLTVLDIFDPAEMTEPSIVRARKGRVRSESIAASARRLPAASASWDAVCLLFAAHELRTAAGREALFAEVHRLLDNDGLVIVAEHLRDVPNFCAFGPGAFHFFPRREWLRVFEHASLHVADEFPITPFVRVFVLRRAS